MDKDIKNKRNKLHIKVQLKGDHSKRSCVGVIDNRKLNYKKSKSCNDECNHNSDEDEHNTFEVEENNLCDLQNQLKKAFIRRNKDTSLTPAGQAA